MKTNPAVARLLDETAARESFGFSRPDQSAILALVEDGVRRTTLAARKRISRKKKITKKKPAKKTPLNRRPASTPISPELREAVVSTFVEILLKELDEIEKGGKK